MVTLLYTHPSFLEHDTGDGHPERIDRLRAVNRVLSHSDFDALERRLAPRAERAQITRVHVPVHVDAILSGIPQKGYNRFDADTVASSGSGEAALHAVGAACAAVEAVMAGEADNAFCAVRPPGHHAERDRAMGFCLFNNVAIAAHHARAKCGIDRVAVLDFDVHHGNGTQSDFELDPTLFYGSSHQSPAYPGTGAASERGCAHNISNAELYPGARSAEFEYAWGEVILPQLRHFGPQLILISAGFDAHIRDPLADVRLTAEDFAWVTREILAVADECCAGRVVSVLEGGYDLKALADSVAAHVRELMAPRASG